jgi:predicted dehydrogenase
MEQTRIAIVGCGGMGRRHLTGLNALYRSSYRNLELEAVCDINRQNAEDLADEAAQMLGRRPAVFADVESMVQALPDLRGVDVTTDARSHHTVACACLDAGLHVQIEKPLALTMHGATKIIEAAQRNNRLLSVAENFRRDPINRLAHALLQDGAIGVPRLMVETAIDGGNRLLITPWRHQKLSGAFSLDAGVHNADIMQYYMGPAQSAFGVSKLHERYRYRADTGGPGGFYAKWAAQVPEVIEATGDDALYGLVQFDNGAVAQWTFDFAGHGTPMHSRQVFGSKGSLASPGDRNGRPLLLSFDDGTVVRGEDILQYAPSHRLEPLAAELFGGERVWTYDFPFPDTDSKIMALEYHEFGVCMQNGSQPEVTGAVGLRAMALVYAVLESGSLGRPVTLEEVERLQVGAYQRDIDASLGLI